MKKITLTFVGLLLTFTLASCSESGPLVLSLASSQGESGQNRMASDSSMIAPDFSQVTISYQLVGKLNDLPTSARSWSITIDGEAMKETQRLADGFGVSARAKKSDDDKYVFFAEDPTTGATVTLWNHLAIGGWWSYSSQYSQTSSVSPSCSPDDLSCVESTETTPPQNLLSIDEAMSRTKQYLAATKFVPEDYVFSATATEWSTEVLGYFAVDGVTSNVTVNFSYGHDGELMYASGPMMKVVAADEYPLVSVDQAIQRLSLPQFSIFGMATSTAVDSTVSSSAVRSDEIVPLEIPITDVRLTLMETNLNNGTHILLPSFTFANADGDVGTVVAITDEFLVFPKLDSDPVDPGVIEPAPDVVTRPLTPETSQELIGLTENEARKIAAERGWEVRVAMRDGEPFMLTTDYLDYRVNFTVEDSLVVDVVIG